MTKFLALIRRELILALRHAGDSVAALLFFIIAASLFAFAIGPAPTVLSGIAPGVIWVIALLAALLPLNRLFAADYEDGALDQLMVSGLPASAVAFGKIIGHWLTTGLPLLVIAGPVAIMLRLDESAVPQLLLTLLPGTILLSLVGGMSAAITLAGDPPSPSNPPGGCPFHPRCGYATEVCKTTKPSLAVQPDGRLTACFHPRPV